MISDTEFQALVDTYAKYGWLLRRVVKHSEDPAPASVPPAVTVVPGVVDAAWFSREPQAGPIPFEIRYLGPTQYALVEHLDEEDPEFDETCKAIEQRLAEAVAAKRFA